MKAMQLNQADRGPALIEAELPQPEPGEGELLIRVRAAGVTQTELSGIRPRTQKMEPSARAPYPGMSSLVSSPHLEETPRASRWVRTSTA